MIKKIAKFSLTGITGTIVDTAVLWLLKTFVFHSYLTVYIVSPAISFEIAMFNNYVISYFWVWRDRVEKKPKDFFMRLLPYNSTCLIAFGVKMALLLLIERIFHFDVVICNILALLVSGIVNFLGGEKWVFKFKEENNES
jgi:putative flippase GtrA